LNRPEKLNALNRDSHLAIKEQCVRVESDDTVRAVVIRGAAPPMPEEGKRSKPAAFAAGADISEFAGKNSDDVREFFANNAWESVWGLSKPTIAMVDGFALGGGTELALACDLRVASTRAKFGQPEINLGLIPGGGGTQRLCRLLGYGKAMEMTLTGEMVGAEEALSIGLVNKVVEPEELEGAALALAESIARKSPYTVRVAKRAVRAALDLPFTEGILTERSEFVALFDTEDKEIGVSAFLEREDAKWVGR
jgi:enoyl-CoA hydratase